MYIYHKDKPREASYNFGEQPMTRLDKIIFFMNWIPSPIFFLCLFSFTTSNFLLNLAFKLDPWPLLQIYKGRLGTFLWICVTR